VVLWRAVVVGAMVAAGVEEQGAKKLLMEVKAGVVK